MKDIHNEILSGESDIVITGVTPLSFNPDEAAFMINHLPLYLSNLHNLTDFKNNIDQSKTDVRLNKCSEMIFVSPSGSLLIMPSLGEWLHHLNFEKRINASELAKASIINVYESVSPKLKVPEYMTHQISVSIQDDGVLDIQNLGAFLGHQPHLASFTGISYNKNDHRGTEAANTLLPTEYILQNMDKSKQGLGIYAAVGTLAWLAKNNPGH